MKLFYRVVFILISFTILSITGCWDSWYDHHRIIRVELKPGLKKDGVKSTIYLETDTFKTGIVFIVRRITEIVAQNTKNFSLIQECKATTRGLKWVNELQKDSYKLSFDTSILLNNDTIHSGSNLLQSSILKDKISIIYSYSNSRGFEDIILLDDSIMNDLQFKSKTFNASFQCITNDNDTLSNSVEVILL